MLTEILAVARKIAAMFFEDIEIELSESVFRFYDKNPEEV
jgi:hypothetical protein